MPQTTSLLSGRGSDAKGLDVCSRTLTSDFVRTTNLLEEEEEEEKVEEEEEEEVEEEEETEVGNQ